MLDEPLKRTVRDHITLALVWGCVGGVVSVSLLNPMTRSNSAIIVIVLLLLLMVAPVFPSVFRPFVTKSDWLWGVLLYIGSSVFILQIHRPLVQGLWFAAATVPLWQGYRDAYFGAKVQRRELVWFGTAAVVSATVCGILMNMATPWVGATFVTALAYLWSVFLPSSDIRQSEHFTKLSLPPLELVGPVFAAAAVGLAWNSFIGAPGHSFLPVVLLLLAVGPFMVSILGPGKTPAWFGFATVSAAGISIVSGHWLPYAVEILSLLATLALVSGWCFLASMPWKMGRLSTPLTSGAAVAAAFFLAEHVPHNALDLQVAMTLSFLCVPFLLKGASAPTLRQPEVPSPRRLNGGSVPVKEWLQAYSLTPQETIIATLLLKGHSNHEITQELFISINTLKTHLKNIYRKTETANRRELAARFRLTASPDDVIEGHTASSG